MIFNLTDLIRKVSDALSRKPIAGVDPDNENRNGIYESPRVYGEDDPEDDEEIDLSVDPAGKWGGLIVGSLMGLLIFMFPEDAPGYGVRIYLAVILAIFVPQLMKTKLKLSIRYFTVWMVAAFVVFAFLGWVFDSIFDLI